VEAQSTKEFKITMKETDMLNAWLWDKHREDLQWRRVRLGVLPTKEMARMYMTILRWADAIVIHDGVVYIVEAKLRAAPGAVGQLKLYKKLLGNTLEFKQYWNWPVQMLLLSSVMDLNMAELASDEDIAFEVFTIEDVNRVRLETMQPVLMK